MIGGCGRVGLLVSLWVIPAHAAVHVAADGSGDFLTVQAAIDAAPSAAETADWWQIHLAAGTYAEALTIPAGTSPIHLMGAGREAVVIRAETGSAALLVEHGEVWLEGLTLEHTTATGLKLQGGRNVLRRCRVVGADRAAELEGGRAFFEDSFLEATDAVVTTDAATAFLERCHLRLRGESGAATVAATPAALDYGLVLANCRVSAPAGSTVWLGEARSATAAVAWLNTNLGAAVAPAGWRLGVENLDTAALRCMEFNSRGAGATSAQRVRWAKPVTKIQSLAWNAPAVLAGEDAWNPVLIDVPPARFVRDVVYGDADAAALLLDIAVPAGDGPFPVALIVHGGGWMGGDKTRDIDPLFAPLTAHGMLWVSINYHLAPEVRWPAPEEDVRAAIRWVQTHIGAYGGDPDRVAIFGHSAGGQLAFMAAMAEQTAGRGVQAMIGMAPVTDFVADSERRGGPSISLQAFLDIDAELRDAVLPRLRETSPLFRLETAPPPVLILHGESDKTVPMTQTDAFAARVRELGGTCDVQVIPGAPHSVVEWDLHDAAWTDAMIAWLQARGW